MLIVYYLLIVGYYPVLLIPVDNPLPSVTHGHRSSSSVTDVRTRVLLYRCIVDMVP